MDHKDRKQKPEEVTTLILNLTVPMKNNIWYMQIFHNNFRIEVLSISYNPWMIVFLKFSLVKLENKLCVSHDSSLLFWKINSDLASGFFHYTGECPMEKSL